MLVSRRWLVLNAGRQFEFDLLLAPGLVHAGLHPFDLGEIDVRRFLEKTARINAGGLRPFRNADGFTFQVLRRLNAAVGAHIERRMAEHARRKYRNADERRIALRGKADELAERHFGNVPLAVLDEAKEHFLDRQHETGQHDALGPHHAAGEIAHVIVVGGGERQMQLRRAAALDHFRLAVGARLPHPARFVDRHVTRNSRIRPMAAQPYTRAPGLYATPRYL